MDNFQAALARHPVIASARDLQQVNELPLVRCRLSFCWEAPY